jgi:hypothetical protein
VHLTTGCGIPGTGRRTGAELHPASATAVTTTATATVAGTAIER